MCGKATARCFYGSSRQQHHTYRFVQPPKPTVSDEGGPLPHRHHRTCTLTVSCCEWTTEVCFGVTTSFTYNSLQLAANSNVHSPVIPYTHTKDRYRYRSHIGLRGNRGVHRCLQQLDFFRRCQPLARNLRRERLQESLGTSMLIAQATSKKSLLLLWNDPALHRRSLPGTAQPHTWTSDFIL